MDRRRLAALLKALGNPERLAILAFLRKGKGATVTAISKSLPSSYQGISHHLQILFAAGVVQRRKRGLKVSYRLSLAQEKVTRTVLGIL